MSDLSISTSSRNPFDILPEFIPLVCMQTESFIAESCVSKAFHRATQDENLHRYFFCQVCSILEVEPQAFERVIQAEGKDSYFVKVRKSIAFLNLLRDRTKSGLCGYSNEQCLVNNSKDKIAGLPGLPRLALPTSTDICSSSLITLCKNAYQEVADTNFILLGEKLSNFPSNLLLKPFENLSHHEKTDQLRLFFIDLNPRYYKSTHLYFDNLGFSLLPKEVGNFKKATTLSLANNQLVILPPVIGNLIHLENINLSSNGFINLPECIFQLKNLKVLDLTQNPLEMTPELLTKLKEIWPNIEVRYD